MAAHHLYRAARRMLTDENDAIAAFATVLGAAVGLSTHGDPHKAAFLCDLLAVQIKDMAVVTAKQP